MTTIPEAETTPDYLDIAGYAEPLGETTLLVYPRMIFKATSFHLFTPHPTLTLMDVRFGNITVLCYDPKTLNARPIPFADLAPLTLLATPVIGPANRVSIVVKNTTNRAQAVAVRFSGVSYVETFDPSADDVVTSAPSRAPKTGGTPP